MAQAASTYLGEQRRRSTRVDQVFPLIIRGVDLLGQPFEERTSTQNLNLNGCRYASKHHLPKNTWVTLEIPPGHVQKNALCVRVRVAWIQRPKTLRELFQVGVELEAAENIWGIAPAPADWERDVHTIAHNAQEQTEAVNSAESESKVSSISAGHGLRIERPLDSYLHGALVESVSGAEYPEMGSSVDENPLFLELRREMERRSRDILKEAIGAAEEVAHKSAEETENRQNAAAEAFYEKWRAEFEHSTAEAKTELAEQLSAKISAEMGRLTAELQSSLSAESARTAEEWRTAAETVREEVRAFSTAAAERVHENVISKLQQELEALRQEWTAARSDETTRPAETSPADAAGIAQESLESARAQWNELLESSLDAAAQRLAGRLADNSQQLLRGSEQKLAARLAELQAESGLSVEAARSALEEMTISLGGELARAKESLGKIERAAAQFSDYSLQLETANQQSLDDLKKKIEANTASRCKEMEQRASEIQQQFASQTAVRARQIADESASEAAREADAKIAPLLDRVEEAAQQLSTHEQKTEELLHIHRERLRQISEQTRRETAESMRASLETLEADFEKARAEAASRWESNLSASSEKLCEAALAAFGEKTAARTDSECVRLASAASEALERAKSNLDEMCAVKSRDFAAQLEAEEAPRIERIRAGANAVIQERLDSTRSGLTLTAEEVAKNFGAAIQGAADEALSAFSSACKIRAEQQESAFNASVERAAEDMDGMARNSLLRFEEQLAHSADDASGQFFGRLSSQTAEALAKYQERSDAHLSELNARQEQLGKEACDRHSEHLREMTSALVDSAVREIDILGQNRIQSLLRFAEANVRRACADIFEGLSRSMRESLETAAPAEPAAMPPSREPEADQRPTA